MMRDRATGIMRLA